jgi:signal transduction histidine kinase
VRAFPTVRARLTAWNAGVVACVLVLSGAAVRYLLEQGLVRGVDQDLTRQAQFWSPFFARRPLPAVDRDRPAPGAERSPTPPATAAALHPRLLNERGQDFWRNGPWDTRAFSRSLAGEQLFTTVVHQGRVLRVYSVPGVRSGRIQGVIQIVASLEPTRKALDELTRTLLILVPIALALAALGGAFLTGRALQPIREITRAAMRIEPQNLSARVPEEGKDELAQLAGVLNGMLARLEEAFERQKRFAGDASHELRTPLATIKAASSLARADNWGPEASRAAMGSIEAAADRASRIVDDLLLLARSDSNRLVAGVTPLRVRDLLERAVMETESAWEVRTPHAAIRVQPPQPEGMQVAGEASHLVRVLVNLLDNAMRHTPAEGEVVISARAERDQVIISVLDSGEGVAPEHLPHLGERFYRADAGRERGRGGAGLGLAICRAILQAHQGRLEIRSSLGQGTEVEVTLPAVPETENG